MVHGKKIEKPHREERVKRQVVAGFVIFRKTEDGIKYLMLYRRGNYWNFPKGHFEAGEKSFDTAIRETEEETGLKKADLRIIPNFKAYERFSFQQGDERIHDTVILYLAETKQANVRISPREHSGYAWFLYADALRALGKKYVATKRVLKKAHDFLRGAGARRGKPHPQGPRGDVPRYRGGDRSPERIPSGGERAQ